MSTQREGDDSIHHTLKTKLSVFSGRRRDAELAPGKQSAQAMTRPSAVGVQAVGTSRWEQGGECRSASSCLASAARWYSVVQWRIRIGRLPPKDPLSHTHTLPIAHTRARASSLAHRNSSLSHTLFKHSARTHTHTHTPIPPRTHTQKLVRCRRVIGRWCGGEALSDTPQDPPSPSLSPSLPLPLSYTLRNAHTHSGAVEDAWHRKMERYMKEKGIAGM